jgi:hypothetical protein
LFLDRQALGKDDCNASVWLWSIIAFIEKLPGMSAEQYSQLKQETPAPEQSSCADSTKTFSGQAAQQGTYQWLELSNY